MGLQAKVEVLTNDIALMREELEQTRAGLRELLDRLSAPSGVVAGPGPIAVSSPAPGSGLPSAPAAAGDPLSSIAPRQVAVAGDQAPRTSAPLVSGGGGLALTQKELGVLLEQAGAGARVHMAGKANGAGRPGLSLESLARTLEKTRVGVDGKGSSRNGDDQPLTMSLSQIALMMKAAQAEDGSGASGVEPDVVPLSGSPDAASRRSRKHQSRSGVPVVNGVTPRHKNPANVPRSAHATRLRAQESLRPKAASGQQPAASSAPVAAGFTSRANSMAHTGPARRPRRVPRSASIAPTVASAGESGSRLDVNLLTNLTRWVGSVKRRLGARKMQELLDTYRLTGHLPPGVESAIVHLSRLSVMIDDSAYHAVTPDDLIDAVQQLHGIIYGAGRAPVGPAVHLDRSEMRVWDAAGDEKDVPAVEEEETESPRVAIHGGLRGGRDEPVPHLSRHMPRGREDALSIVRSSMLTPSTPNVDDDTCERKAPSASPAPGLQASGITTAAGEAAPRHHNGDRPPRVAGADRPLSGVQVARNAYPSDLSDDQWRRAESLVPGVKPGGRPSKYARREILNGILYQLWAGCSWRSLPGDFPPWKIVHHYYRRWRAEGLWAPINEALALGGDGTFSAEGDSPGRPPPPVADDAGTGRREGGGRPSRSPVLAQ